jgi:hypothetical protein
VEKNAPDSMKFLEELGTSFFVFWILWIFHEIHMYSLFLARPKWGTQPQPTHSNVGQFSSGSLVAMVGHDHFFQERQGGIWDATRKNEWKKVFQPKVRFEPLWGHQNGITWATRNRTAATVRHRFVWIIGIQLAQRELGDSPLIFWTWLVEKEYMRT